METRNDNNKQSKKRALFLIILIGLILAISAIFIIVSESSSGNRKKATIYVDGSVYTSLDLTNTEDSVIEIVNSKGNVCHIQIKDHDIRMLDSDCKNGLCVSQGWADNSLVPIVCLPNNVVISVSSKDTEKGGSEYDAISY